jgi:hypothetical protein
MGRTVIREETTSPGGYVEERSGSGIGVAVGIVLGVLLVILAVLLMRGTWDNDSPSPGTGNNEDSVPSAPAQPDNDEPAQEPSALPT